MNSLQNLHLLHCYTWKINFKSKLQMSQIYSTTQPIFSGELQVKSVSSIFAIFFVWNDLKQFHLQTETGQILYVNLGWGLKRFLFTAIRILETSLYLGSWSWPITWSEIHTHTSHRNWLNHFLWIADDHELEAKFEPVNH